MIYAFTNSKGGVGKSTMSVHFAAWLKEEGAAVALVDADVQESSSQWLHEVEPAIPIHRLQTAEDMLDRLPKITLDHDCVVVDGPAGLSEVTRCILLLADCALLPCGPSVLDLRAANDAIRAVRQAQRIRQGPPAAFLIPNKLQINYRLSQEFLEAIKSLEIPSLGGLRLRQAYADAVGQGTVVWKMNNKGATEAAAEIKTLFTEFAEYERQTIHEHGVANG